MLDISAFVQRWQDGDERAAEAIYNHFRESTFRLAYGLLGHRADAEETAQDALTYALTHITCYDPQRASFSTWHSIRMILLAPGPIREYFPLPTRQPGVTS